MAREPGNPHFEATMIARKKRERERERERMERRGVGVEGEGERKGEVERKSEIEREGGEKEMYMVWFFFQRLFKVFYFEASAAFVCLPFVVHPPISPSLSLSLYFFITRTSPCTASPRSP